MFYLIVNEMIIVMCLLLNKKENLKFKIVLFYNVLKMVKILNFVENMLWERGMYIVYRKRIS